MQKKDNKVFHQKQNLDLNIDNYNGSYEKLLDLVQEKKIDLLNINLLEIIEQFIEFVNELSSKNLDEASEYLAMSAYLLQVKSKYLIPKEKLELEDLETGSSEKELFKRIMIMKTYREITDIFRISEKERSKLIDKPVSDLTPYNVKITDEEILFHQNLSIATLYSSIEKMHGRIRENFTPPARVKIDMISPEERTADIMKILQQKKGEKIFFSELFEIRTKAYVIATFLSLLDLVKNRIIDVFQAEVFDKIYVVYGEEQNES